MNITQFSKSTKCRLTARTLYVPNEDANHERHQAKLKTGCAGRIVVEAVEFANNFSWVCPCDEATVAAVINLQEELAAVEKEKEHVIEHQNCITWISSSRECCWRGGLGCVLV